MTIRPSITAAAIGLLLAAHPATAADCSCPVPAGKNPLLPGNPDPADQWTLDFESGALWRVSGNTWINYLVLPQVFSIRTPEHFRIAIGGHDLTLRARLSLLAEPIADGPESLYLGFSASPSLEYWFVDRTACIYAGIGGGFGAIDSTDVSGGQGQDFTLNWFATSGLRWYVKPDLAINAGVFFQHWSNGGATDPNPGLDALGPMVGVSWTF